MTTIYRQTLTFNDTSASLDVAALHNLVMSGYFHALEGGHDDARNQLNSLFLAQRATPTTRGNNYPPLARRTNRVLVQANTVGDWSGTDPNLGITASDPIAVDLHVSEGDQVEIQTLVNPTHALAPQPKGDGHYGRGKRVVLTRPNEIATWLERTMDGKGLTLDPSQTTIGTPERLTGVRTAANTRNAITIDVRLLRATGTVTDPEAFTRTLTTGIGRGRPYGAGLIRHRRVA